MLTQTVNSLRSALLYLLYEPDRLMYWAEEEEGMMFLSVYLSLVFALVTMIR